MKELKVKVSTSHKSLTIAYNHDWDQPNPRIKRLLTHNIIRHHHNHKNSNLYKKDITKLLQNVSTISTAANYRPDTPTIGSILVLLSLASPQNSLQTLAPKFVLFSLSNSLKSDLKGPIYNANKQYR